MISDKGPEELCLSESIPVNTKLNCPQTNLFLIAAIAVVHQGAQDANFSKAVQ